MRTSSDLSGQPIAVRQDHISYAAAAAVVEAGLAKARELGEKSTVSVTDPSGGIIALGRMDGVQAGTIKAATGKAYYSARSGRTTQDFIENRLVKDEVLWRAVSSNPDTFLVPGGFPLIHDGVCIGGVGVSGGKYQDDVKIAEAAAEFFAGLVVDR